MWSKKVHQSENYRRITEKEDFWDDVGMTQREMTANVFQILAVTTRKAWLPRDNKLHEQNTSTLATQVSGPSCSIMQNSVDKHHTIPVHTVS